MLQRLRTRQSIKRYFTSAGCAMGIVLSAAVALLWVLSAGLVGQMAEEQGHNRLHWYVSSLFCSPLLGFIVVSLLTSLRI